MTFKRTVSMPEANHLLASSFPMRVSEINDLGPVKEHEEYFGGMHEPESTKQEAGKDRIAKSSCDFTNLENEVIEDTMDDDYGFFPMDDEDFTNAEPEGRRNIILEDAISTSGSDSSSDPLASSYNSSGCQKKSALKRGSAYGNADEGIPLDFERKDFNRVLPKPDLSRRVSVDPRTAPKPILRSGSRGLFRVSSEPVFVRPVYQSQEHAPDDEDETLIHSVPSGGFLEGAMKKRISFGTIQIREHAQTIGDNPSCTYGTPVQLDWDHQDLEALNVDDYESFRPRQRTKEEFHMNHFQRRNLLKLNGYSTSEIKDSKKKVAKHRSQRERTKFLQMNYPQIVMVEAAIESGLRKVKQSISKSKINEDVYKEMIPKKSSKDDLSMYASISKELLLKTMDNDTSNATAPF
mmetsp:Transcript_16898/g.39030  ORF Transcript_16898/g.39030 Transcript_16898/m.39030 type:complete len:407 (+) Transcript_16898:162-1382(+)